MCNDIDRSQITVRTTLFGREYITSRCLTSFCSTLVEQRTNLPRGPRAGYAVGAHPPPPPRTLAVIVPLCHFCVDQENLQTTLIDLENTNFTPFISTEEIKNFPHRNKCSGQKKQTSNILAILPRNFENMTWKTWLNFCFCLIFVLPNDLLK